MKRILLLAVMAVLIFSGVAFAQKRWDAFKSGSEPDGFRGIKWGTDIKELEDMKQVETECDGLLKSYTSGKGEAPIGRAGIEVLYYYFWKDKFYKVCIMPYASDAEAFREVVFARFGIGKLLTPASLTGIKEVYRWEGEKAKMWFTYNRLTPRGTAALFIEYKGIDYEIEKWKQQKAKEGAETGF